MVNFLCSPAHISCRPLSQPGSTSRIPSVNQSGFLSPSLRLQRNQSIKQASNQPEVSFKLRATDMTVGTHHMLDNSIATHYLEWNMVPLLSKNPSWWTRSMSPNLVLREHMKGLCTTWIFTSGSGSFLPVTNMKSEGNIEQSVKRIIVARVKLIAHKLLIFSFL